MNCQGSPKVIEYNVRMGDPETEVVIPRIKSDLLMLLDAVGRQKLDETRIEIEERSASTVMMVSGGYPEQYEKGKIITGLENVKDSMVFHAGTRPEVGQVVTNGGRVLAVTSLREDMKEALATSYDGISKIDFDKKYYRKDIGKDVL